MTSLDGNGPNPTESASFSIPAELTATARARYIDAVREYADWLQDGIRTNAARRPWTPEREFNIEDVNAACAGHEHRGRSRRSDTWRQVLATGLITVGSAGASIMANVPQSGWQIGVLVAFVAVGLFGIGLALAGA